MHVLRQNQIEEQPDDFETDYEMLTPNHFWGNNINMIPMQGAVQSARLFYGSRFFNQAMPVVNGEAPLVQAQADLHPGKSFDELASKNLGVVHSAHDGEVTDVQPNAITLRTAAGKQVVQIHKLLPFNRKSALRQTPVVKLGDTVVKGQLLAHSNYTDEKGTQAMGLNARMALVPCKGKSMDDALVISEDFAKRLTSEHVETHDQQYDDDIKGGREHFSSLFPKKYTRDQLSSIDDNGIVKVGTVLKPGDPMFLATRPRSFSSATASLGNLSRSVRMSRSDAATNWESEDPGEVTDVVKSKDGYKIVTRALHPTKIGDKVVMRPGAKGIVADILPSDRMPRTADGRPLDMLQNQLGLPSRVNPNTALEMLLGKIAEKQGTPIKVPAFNKKGEDWTQIIGDMLKQHGLTPEEEIFDPATGKNLDRPVTVGNAYVLKLHHVSASKLSARGQAGYDSDRLPAKGGGEAAQSKRLSGLESGAMLSSGAYANLRESATLRGTRNDEYWRDWREGKSPRVPGKPFVWDKFLGMLQGAGINPIDKGKGIIRIGPMTDKHVDELNPIEVRNGGIVNFKTMEPEPGGLFDTSLVGANRWGVMHLPRSMPNPAFEETVRQLLGLTKAELSAVMNGDKHLSEVQKSKL